MWQYTWSNNSRSWTSYDPLLQEIYFDIIEQPIWPIARDSKEVLQKTINLDPAWLYPKICGICDKVTAKYKENKVRLTKIVTQNAANNLKEYAKNKDLELYSAIEAEDIIAREFQ